MSTLVVLAFPTESGAHDVLDVVKDLQRQQLIAIDDAAIVVRGQDGKPKTQQAESLVGQGAMGGAFWGLLFGLIFFVPFLGMAIGAAAGALMGKFTDVGIDDRFIREVQEKIKAGQSGLFLLVRDVKLDRVLPALEPYQPEVIQTSLSAEQEARLRETLGGAPPEAMVAAAAVVEAEGAVAESAAVAPLAPVESGFRYLFDNTGKTFEDWRYVGDGGFAVVDGVLEAQPGEDWGILYYAAETFEDFDLRMDFRLDQFDSDSGVFVRFRDPLTPVPDRVDPSISYAYERQQWVGVNTGFEVQIDELARGADEEREEHRTGAIYDIPLGPAPGQQQYQRGPALTPGTWHQLEVEVKDNTYRVNLDGTLTTTFTNTDPLRGQPPGAATSSGYIGLQSFLGRVAFRNVRIKTP